MVIITNGSTVFKVTQGAYESIFSKHGYFVHELESDIDGKIHDDDEMAEDGFIKAIEEKPIAQWTKHEVKRYAESCNVDISGTKSIAEAKNVIKQFLENRQAS
jgi:hypothetical protein